MNNLKCLACGSTESEKYAVAVDGEYFTLSDQFLYNKCQDCKSLFIDPVPTNLLDIIYPKNYYSFVGQEKKSLLLKIKVFLDSLLFKRILSAIIGNTINILDVGGGDGWLIDTIMTLDRRVSKRQIVDLDVRAGDLAVAKGHSYHLGGIENYRSEEKFNLVLMFNLIEHVSDPTKVLKNIKELMSEDGIILIKTPNWDSLDARIFRHLNWGGYHCPRHWVLFSMESFNTIALSLGFQVVSKKYTQGAPFWAWSILYFLHRKKLIKISKNRPAGTHPLSPLLTGLFAAFDFLRMPFSKTSQMIFVLRKTQ